MPPRLPPLLPAPKRARALTGSIRLSDGLPIVLAPDAGDSERGSARALRDFVVDRCGVVLAIEGHARSDDLGPRVVFRCDAADGDGYRLSVRPDAIEIAGDGPAGLRYGVETLTQLVSGAGRVPACEIDDAPDLRLRGVMLDISRGKVPTAETLRGIVDFCVRMKLNVFMLYTEHTFRFRRHPKIGADASPLDAETLRDLDAYAAARHVDLVPSLQSLGHMEHILALPEYAHLAETDARWTLSPADPGTYALLEDLYAEFLPNFRSRYFNANCDEPYDLEAGRSASRAREIGPGGVYLEHAHRLRELAAKHGKRTMIWSDVVHSHPERIPELDRDLILLDWWYEAELDYERVAAFAKNGIEFVVCPGTSSWNCLFPRMENACANTARYAAAGVKHGALGLLTTDWGDFGHYNLQGNSWFGYAWAAQQAWSGDTHPRDFERAFSRAVFGDDTGVTGRIYRELGGIHDAGFDIFNGSPLQFLYFDDLARGFFVEASRAGPLRRTLGRLDRVRDRIVEARDRFARDPLTHEELLLAAECSQVAARKGIAGAEYVAWRRRPSRLAAAARRKLAREMQALAREQAELARRLHRLWLRRSRPSNFEITKRRLTRSIASLRRASRALAAGRPPAPPPPHPGINMASVFAALRASTRAEVSAVSRSGASSAPPRRTRRRRARSAGTRSRSRTR